MKSLLTFAFDCSLMDAEDHPEYCVRKKDGSVATIILDAHAAPTDRRIASSIIDDTPSESRIGSNPWGNTLLE